MVGLERKWSLLEGSGPKSGAGAAAGRRWARPERWARPARPAGPDRSEAQSAFFQEIWPIWVKNNENIIKSTASFFIYGILKNMGIFNNMGFLIHGI